MNDLPEHMRAAAQRALGGVATALQPSARAAEQADRAVQAIASTSRPEKGDARRKHGNHPTTVDGIRFDSKKEARYYEVLKLRRAAGEVAFWLRQTPIHLPGGTRYVLDFLVFFTDPSRPAEWVDVKGHETKEFRIKKREVEHHYPIRILLP